MKVSLEWLKEYSDVDVELKDLFEMLTMTGSKVEAIESKGNNIKNVVVGKILEIEKHPDADKLVVTKVDAGTEKLQIVTGANNIKVGDIIPIAKDGAELPGGVKIKTGKLRGIDSCGMMCSIGELELTLADYPEQIENGIMILPKEYEKSLGKDIVEVLNLKEDSDVISKKTEVTVTNSVFDDLLLNIRNFKDGKDIEDIWFEIYKIFEKDEEWNLKLKTAIKGLGFSNKPENLNEDNVKKLYGDTLKTSVSRLENYKKCAFSFYLTYALKLKDEKTFKLENLDTGSFMHEVIDTFFEEIENNKINIKEITDEKTKEIIDKIIEEKLNLKENYIFISSAKFRNQTFRLKRLIIKAMKYIILSINDSEFEVLGHEVEFGENKKYPPIEIELEDRKKSSNSW